MSINNILKNRKVHFLLLVVFNIVFFVLSAMLLPFRFEENDDVVMCMMANGVFSGTPDCHLVFINAVYGLILTFLYGITKSVEWYTISFACLHIISMSVIIYQLILDEKAGVFSKVVIVAFFYVLWLRVIIALQFTTTAGLTCLAGCSLLRCQGKKSKSLGVFLIVVASMIRFHAAALVGILFSPLFFYEFGVNWVRYIPVVIVIVLSILFKLVDNCFYSSESWREFKEYNNVRGEINDNPNAGKILDCMPANIDSEDFIMMYNFCSDPSVMKKNVLLEINDKIGTIKFSERLRNIKDLKKYWAVVSVLAVGCLLAMFSTIGKKGKLYICLSYFLWVFVLMIISMNGIVKDRVFLCSLMTIIYNMYFLSRKSGFDMFSLSISLAIMLVLFKYSKQTINIRHRDSCWRETEWKAKQIPILDSCKDKYIYTLVGCLSIEYTNPLKIKDINYRFLNGGWMVSMPVNSVLKSHIELLSEDVFVFTSDRDEYLVKMIDDGIYRNHGITAADSIVTEIGDFKLFKIYSTQTNDNPF